MLNPAERNAHSPFLLEYMFEGLAEEVRATWKTVVTKFLVPPLNFS